VDRRTSFAETTMRMMYTLMLGAAAVMVATAASYPEKVGMYRDTSPNSLRQREALDLCAQQDRSFVRFLASDREECYRQMRGVGAPANYSGVWSKPDRLHPQFAQN
jgi:hypothetical protein